MRLVRNAALLVLGACPAIASASTIAIASAANPAFVGQAVTLRAVVSGQQPTGTVRFMDGALTIGGCEAVPLEGEGDTRIAPCTTTWLAPGTHEITASYLTDPYNGPASTTVAQFVALPTPGNAKIVNPYGTLVVSGATLVGDTLTDIQGDAWIQLGNGPIAGDAMEIRFEGLNLGPGTSFSVRSGAGGQVVRFIDVSGKPSAIAGSLGGNDFGGAGFPSLQVENPYGIVTYPGGGILTLAPVLLDTLGDTWLEGGPLVNHGVIAADDLEIRAASITGGGTPGGGEFRADRITLRTFGNAHNPIHGDNFRENGLFLQPNSGVLRYVDVTLDAYGPGPQVFNLRVIRDSGAIVRMPPAWSPGSPFPPNNATVPPGGVRAAGVPDPAYGGGSMIIRAQGEIILDGGGTGEFAFPGAIVLESDVAIDTHGVALNQSWTTSGQAFQGIFLEAPRITSTGGPLRVYGNELNWVNFSSMPTAPVRAFTLARNADGSASHVPADATTPHLNAYSLISNAAITGQCWTCLVDPRPVDMYGPGAGR